MRILIVDNDHDIAEAIQAVIVTKTGYQVDVAYSGQEGLDKMRAEVPYDLLILDIMMPGMSGIDVCKVMMQDEKLRNIPVILASALPVQSEEFQASRKQFEELKLVTDVLEKPFEVEDLITKINASIQAKQNTP